MILIIASELNEHVVEVRKELAFRNERACVFDICELPRRASIVVEPCNGAVRAHIKRSSDSFDLQDVRTVWLRRTSLPDPEPNLCDRPFAIEESRHLLVGLAQCLSDRLWVNPLASLAMDGGWNKIGQLRAAQQAGLEIPRTLMTNDTERARKFLAACTEGAVYKPFASVSGKDRTGRHSAIFTTLVDPKADLSPIAHAPVILQERVPKKLELRVTVMRDRAFACEIHSQEHPESLVDYRHQYMTVPRSAHALPPEIEAKILAVHRSLGLVFGTADLIVTPDGRYVFLETNQQGMWLWTADVFPENALVGAFCDLLTSKKVESAPSAQGTVLLPCEALG